jgi:hypothetical protein
MRLVDLYRGLLFLYPVAFRDQFSEEMVSVFKQRAGERPGTLNFFVTEFSSIAKGACIMWLAKILAVNRNPPPSETADALCTPVTIAEINSQRQTAIRMMVASIARHDFLNARRYSYEETRLKLVLYDLESGTPAPEGETA